MALIGDTTARYSGRQTRDTNEDVLDVLFDTALMAVPAYAMIGRGRAPGNIKIEWVTDYLGTYPATTTDITFVGEGDDAVPALGQDVSVLFNRTGILGKAWSVSHTQEAVRLYGVESAYDREEDRRVRQLLREVYWHMHNGALDVDSNGPNSGSAGNKRKFGGFADFCTNFANYVSQTTLATGNKPTSTAQAATAFAASDLTGHLETMWNLGGIPNGVIQGCATAASKRIISSVFAPTSTSNTIYRREFGNQDKMITLPVDIVQTEVCDIHLHLDPGVASGSLHTFTPEFWETNMLREFEVIELAKTGHSMKGSAEVEMTQSFLAPNTFGKLTSIA